jgi:osmotically-inducible protein OsmY
VPKGSINVNVERGIVVLRGEVPDDTMRGELISRVETMAGVWAVRNLLHLPGETAPQEAIATS